MAKNSVDVYGAKTKTNLMGFDPDELVLVTDEKHPLYDSRVHLPLDENMVRNIDYQGVIQPIEVCKNTETGKIEVVLGRQRVKNAREANRRRRERGDPIRLVPGFVRSLKPKDRVKALTTAIASENVMRKQETPISRAEKMAQQIALGRSDAEMEVIFGCKMATIHEALRLLECCQAVRDAVESGTIKANHALKLAELPPEEQRAKVEALCVAGEGAKGHAKARAQRAVLEGEAPPRMMTRKKIEAELEQATGERASALRWVLGFVEDGAATGTEDERRPT
ncbi:hypothetical protein [Paraburkholderia sp. J10-1]|uniref:ParB/RepB/Spo0J family partition protein n=1 Tax=Paraburkholderia sp. J10-1 TaxID=2805430 RepID=UPI002AB797D1|nr:hypothetical protein [Paraburkholderia sp. J10-1]